MFFSMTMFAQLEYSTWIHHIDKADLYIKFEENTMQLGFVGDDRAINFSTYNLVSDTLKLIDLSSGRLCEPSKKEAAIYFVRHNAAKDSLFLDVIDDECLARGESLDGLGWSLQKPQKGDLNYVIIRIYDDEIVVNGKHRPEALYITDLNGKPLHSVNRMNHIGIAGLDEGDYILQVWDEGSMQWAKKFNLE